MAQRVSLCLIAKNEEATLPTCLASTAGLFDEVIVVDTGSTDRTREVAAEFQARVVEFAWVDSFAAARNEGLRHARGDWVFYLDADESLDDANREKLRALLAGLADDRVAYVLHQRSRVPGTRASRLLLDRVCLFPNRPEHRWRYRVHEQIVPALAATGVRLERADVAVEHTGYEDPAHTRRKAERYLRLLELDHAERPGDSFVEFNLGWTNLSLGRAADALPHLRRARERPAAVAHMLPWLGVLHARCLRQLGRADEALAVLVADRGRFPADASLHLEEAVERQRLGDLAGAEACLRSLLCAPPADGPAPCPGPTLDGARGYLARYHLGAVLAGQGRAGEAEAEWRAVLAERPAFAPAASQLAEIFLNQGRWPEVEPFAAALEGECGWPAEAAVLRARACLQAGDPARARRVTEAAAAAHPENVWPRVVLSHALLQEGNERDAEAALREVVRLDAGQAESWRNLAKLLRNQGRLAEAADACAAGRAYFPDEPDLLRVQGLCLQEMNDYAEAEPCLLRYLEVRAGRPDLREPEREHVAAARYQLGRVYRGLGCPEDAETQWRALVAEVPAFTAAWLELGNLYLESQNWPELGRVATRLEADFGLAEEAALLRASARSATDRDEPARL